MNIDYVLQSHGVAGGAGSGNKLKASRIKRVAGHVPAGYAGGLQDVRVFAPIGVDNEGNCWINAGISTSGSLYKIDKNANPLFFKTLAGYTFNDMVCDPSGNVYIVTQDSQAYKLAPDGTTLIAAGIDGYGSSVDYDNNGNLYYSTSNTHFVGRINANGTKAWSKSLGQQISLMRVDSKTGHVYVTHNNGSIQKYDLNGNLVWERTGQIPPTTGSGVVPYDGYLYHFCPVQETAKILGRSETVSKTVFKVVLADANMNVVKQLGTGAPAHATTVVRASDIGVAVLRSFGMAFFDEYPKAFIPFHTNDGFATQAQFGGTSPNGKYAAISHGGAPATIIIYEAATDNQYKI